MISRVEYENQDMCAEMESDFIKKGKIKEDVLKLDYNSLKTGSDCIIYSGEYKGEPFSMLREWDDKYIHLSTKQDNRYCEELKEVFTEIIGYGHIAEYSSDNIYEDIKTFEWMRGDLDSMRIRLYELQKNPEIKDITEFVNF